MMQADEIVDRYRRAREALWGGKPPVPVVRLPEPRSAPPEPPKRPKPELKGEALLRKVRADLAGMMPQVRGIVEAACHKWEVVPEDLVAGAVSRAYTLARIDIVNTMLEAGFRQPRIARTLNRDRASIFHLRRRYYPGSSTYEVLLTAHETAKRKQRRK